MRVRECKAKCVISTVAACGLKWNCIIRGDVVVSRGVEAAQKQRKDDGNSTSFRRGARAGFTADLNASYYARRECSNFIVDVKIFNYREFPWL